MLKEFLNLCSTQEKTGVTKLKNSGISTKSVDTSIMCLLILISTTSQFSDIRKTIILMNSESRSLIFEECYYKISLPNFTSWMATLYGYRNIMGAMHSSNLCL